MPRPVLQLVAAALAICAIGAFTVGFLNVPGRGRLPGEAAPGEAGLNNAAEVRPLNADEFLTPQPPEPDEPEEAEVEEVEEAPANQAAALPAPKIPTPKPLEPPPPAPEPAPPQPAAPEDPPF